MERESLEEGLLTGRFGPPSETKPSSNGAGRPNDNLNMPSAPVDSSLTPVLVFSTFVAVCGSFCYGCSYSVFGSILTIGGMVGAILSGKMADLIGRKRHSQRLTSTLKFFLFGKAMLSFEFDNGPICKKECERLMLTFCWKNALWLDIGRLSIGIGVAVTCYVVPVYIAEITPKSHRGSFASANQLMVTSGFVLIFFIGTIIAWRTLAMIGAISCVIQIIGLFFVPESPRWLVYMETLEQQTEASFLELFQRRYANALIIGVGLMFLQQLGGNSAMAYYTGSIFKEAGISGNLGLQALAIVQIPISISCLFLMDRSGRRPLLLVSASGMCLAAFIQGLAFCFKELPNLKELTPSLVLTGSMIGSAAYTVGLGGIPWIIMSEIFPINVKAQAGSLVTLVNWSTAWLITYTFNFMMAWSSAGVTVVFAAMLVPETKGRTLEEIQASIAHFL
ncbi:hypothetical protein V6N13_090807 [Hibiscus sabdariffa]